VGSALTADDLYNFRWLDHIRLSPSGDRVAYQLTWADAEARENRGRVYFRSLDPGAEAVEVASPAKRDHSPEWSPDGTRLAMVGKVGARDQVLVAQVGGGEARQLTDTADGAASPLWSPDGSKVAFLATVLAEADGVVDDPRPPESAEQARRPPVARVARTLDYKHDGLGYNDGRRKHLFVVEAEGGTPRQLTEGPWDVGGFDWAPDSTRLVVAGDAEPDADRRVTSNLYEVALDGSRRLLLRDRELAGPVWSPRGGLIAFLAPLVDGPGTHPRVWVVASAGGDARCLTAALDRSAAGSVITDMRGGHGVRLTWSPEGDRVHFIAGGPGTAELFSVDLAGGVREELGGARAIADFDVGRGSVVFAAGDPSTPGELYTAGGGRETRLSDVNAWLRDRYVAQPERHVLTAPDGWEIEGWLLKPENFDPSRKHPLVMEIHGGPHSQYGWLFFHEFQVLAGMGFLVFYVNPRGSDGKTEAFRRAVVRDWGGRDYQDLMSSLDQLIERTGYVDTSRMGVGGGSYGGFMTNWVIGHTDRFAAAVAMRSISNLVSDYAQNDIVHFHERELGPPPWSDPEELWRHSPIRYVDDIRTPLLLTHGEMDLRCPISQAEELFGALRLIGREVELVRFPGESHDLSRSGRPDRRVERLNRITGWFSRHLLEREPSLAAAARTEPL
jgi:dipeptidyl aminopeptidase/acylaminoacyl peptidase